MIYNEEIKKDFNDLSKHVKEFLRKYGNPHTTIIATQTGIELLQGELANTFFEIVR